MRALLLPPTLHCQGWEGCSLLPNQSDSAQSPAHRLTGTALSISRHFPPVAAHLSASFNNLGAKLHPFKLEDFNGFSNKKIPLSWDVSSRVRSCTQFLSFTFLWHAGLSSFVHSKSHFVGEVPYHS